MNPALDVTKVPDAFEGIWETRPAFSFSLIPTDAKVSAFLSLSVEAKPPMRAEVTSLIVRIRVDPRAFFFPQHLVIPSVTALAVSSSDLAELPPPWSSAPRKAGLVEGAFTLSRRTTNLSGNFRPLPTSGLCALPPHLI